MSNPLNHKRTYFLIFLGAAIVILLAMFVPRQLALPVLYRAQTTVTIDRDRYRELYDAEGVLDADFDAVVFQAQRIMAARYPGFGEAELAYTLTQNASGIDVHVDATDPQVARRVADEFADMLVLSVRAAGGREILRNLLGWEITLAVRGESTTDPATVMLREFLRQSIFVFSRPIEPVADYVQFSALPETDQYDLVRAVEYRLFELTALEIPQTEQTDDQQRLALMRDTLRGFVATVTATAPSLSFDATRSDVVWRTRATVSTTPLPRYIEWAVGLSVVFGFLATVLLYLFDRSVDIVDRVREIWRFRVLLVYLVQRNLLIRYKGSFLGFAWTQIVPMAQLLVYWVVFGYFLQGNALPLYPLFVVCGLLPWIFTSEAIALAVRSVHDNANLVRQAYFPREVLPVSSVFTSMVNFLLSLPVLFVFMVGIRWFTYGTLSMPWTVVYLPVVLLVHLIFLIGLSLLLTALAIYSIDTIHFVGIFLQIWFFLNPIVYSLASVNQGFARLMRWLNPLASIIEYYREIVYGTPQIGVLPTPGIPATESILRTLLTGLVIFAVGYWLFRRVHDSVSERL
jgi:lipopolysaccharide transport system permease protein